MIAEELERLAALHRAGSLTDAEFTAAKDRLLAGGGAAMDASPGISRNLETNWVRTQQQYMFHEGGIPTRGAMLVIWVFTSIFCLFLFLVLLASDRSVKPEGKIIAAFGLVFLIAMVSFQQSRANRFYRAERRARDLRFGQGTTRDGWQKVDGQGETT